jgi:hypothetical protein
MTKPISLEELLQYAPGELRLDSAETGATANQASQYAGGDPRAFCQVLPCTILLLVS